MPSHIQGHTVYDLTALWLGKAARQPHSISPSTFVVLFGMAQGSLNGAENMKVGRQPKNETEPAKNLRSSRWVNPGQHSASPHPSRAYAGLGNDWITREKTPSLTRPPLIGATPLD